MTAAPVPLDAKPPCKDDPELFFDLPGRNTEVNQKRAEEAKAVCRPCRLIGGCLDYALTHAVEGVWGGTDDDERQAIRKRRGIIPLPITFGKGSRGWGLEPHGTPARYRQHLRDKEKACRPCLDAEARYRRPENPSQWDGRAS